MRRLLVFIGVATFLDLCLFRGGEGDMFIFLTYARNMAKGYPFQFNVGESSLGTTSFLWTTLITSLAFFLNENQFPIGVKIVSGILHLISVGFFFQIARKLYREDVALVAAGLWACNPVVAYWGVSGMETMLFVILLFALLTLYHQLHDTQRDQGSVRYAFLMGMVGGLMILCRPESAALLGLVVLLDLVRYRTKGLRDLLIFSSVVGTILLGPLIWIWKTFHRLMLFSGEARLQAARADILLSSWGLKIGPIYVNWGTLAILAIVGGGGIQVLLLLHRTHRSKWVDSPILFLAYPFIGFYALFFSLYCPTHYGGRYILPALALCYLVVAPTVVQFWNKGTFFYHIRLSSSSMRIMFSLYAVSLFGLLFHDQSEKSTMWNYDVMGMKEFGRWLQTNTDENALIASCEVQVAYYSHRRVLSLEGLIDGKAFPYLNRKADIKEFFQRYRPDYLETVNIPPRLGFYPSIRKIIDHVPPHSTGTSYKSEGIEFIRLRPDLLKIRYY